MNKSGSLFDQVCYFVVAEVEAFWGSRICYNLSIKPFIFLFHYLACPGLSKERANGGMAQFQEMMRQQLESSMHTELEKLLDTTTEAEKEVR